jgi:methyl-accepting chemotaxis protein
LANSFTKYFAKYFKEPFSKGLTYFRRSKNLSAAEIVEEKKQDTTSPAATQAQLYKTIESGVEKSFSSVFTRTTGSSWNVLTRNANDGGANSVLATLILSKTSQQLDSARDTVQKMMESSTNLSKVISGLELISMEINGLSDQSKIVSLNAFIEATHAGEHEKDFAVVAKELGDLSENIKKITVNMHQLLRSINEQVKANREICAKVAGTFVVVDSDLKEFNFLMDKVKELSSAQTQSFGHFESEMNRHFQISENKKQKHLRSVS